jgi:hypothetical protein
MTRRRSTLALRCRQAARGGIAISVALWLSGCASMTFSKEGAIDFDRYPSVRVVVTSDNSLSDTTYLAEQLGNDSGFESVTTDVAVTTSLVLSVSLTVTEEIETDSDGNTDSSWKGEASYTATDSAGKLVDRGAEHDNSEFANEVAEDVLDEISLHYFRPFRI